MLPSEMKQLRDLAGGNVVTNLDRMCCQTGCPTTIRVDNEQRPHSAIVTKVPVALMKPMGAPNQSK